MGELLVLISEYLTFRAARGFQPNRKTERLLTQFVGCLAAERDDGLLFSQGEALAWAHAPSADVRHGCLLGCPPSDSSRSISPAPACQWACPQPVKESAEAAELSRICTRLTTSGLS